MFHKFHRRIEKYYLNPFISGKTASINDTWLLQSQIFFSFNPAAWRRPLNSAGVRSIPLIHDIMVISRLWLNRVW